MLCEDVNLIFFFLYFYLFQNFIYLSSNPQRTSKNAVFFGSLPRDFCSQLTGLFWLVALPLFSMSLLCCILDVCLSGERTIISRGKFIHTDTDKKSFSCLQVKQHHSDVSRWPHAAPGPCVHPGEQDSVPGVRWNLAQISLNFSTLPPKGLLNPMGQRDQRATLLYVWKGAQTAQNPFWLKVKLTPTAS